MKAFPNGIFTDNKGAIIGGQEGMDLRDYFAAKAMSAFINCAKSGTPFGVDHPEINFSYAKASYAMADAMLKARNERV